MNKIYVGYITGPFGLKGEVKIKSDINHTDMIFKSGNKLYIDDETYIINTVRYHKDNYLILFNDLDDISKVENLFKKDVYINRDEFNLSDDDYFISELYNLEIYESNVLIGKVEDILLNKKNIYIKSNDLIIPLIDKYIEKIDVKSGKICVKVVGELRL